MEDRFPTCLRVRHLGNLPGIVGYVEQAIHGGSQWLRVAKRRQPHDLRRVILAEAKIGRHPFPEHADGMRVGNLLDHLQARLAASSQPGGRRFPDAIDDEHGRRFQPGCMVGAGRVREMMGNEVKERVGNGDFSGVGNDPRNIADAVIEGALAPFASKTDGITDRIRIAADHGQTFAGHEGICDGVNIRQPGAVCGPEAIADCEPGQLIGIGDASDFGVFLAGIAFFLGSENDFTATDDGGWRSSW